MPDEVKKIEITEEQVEKLVKGAVDKSLEAQEKKHISAIDELKKELAKNEGQFKPSNIIVNKAVDESNPSYLGAYIKAMAISKEKNISLKDAAQQYKDKSKTLASDVVCKALNESIVEDGGIFVEPQIQAGIVESLKAESAFRKIPGINHVLTKSAEWKKRIVTDGASAFWEGENTFTGSASAVKFGMLSANPKKSYSWITITKDLIADTGREAEKAAQKEMISAMSLLEETAFFNGLGVEYQPDGLINVMAAANKQAQTGTTAANIETDLLALWSNTYGANAKGPGCYVLHPRTLLAYFQKREATNNFRAFPDLLISTAKGGSLFNYPVLPASNLPITLGGGTETQVWLILGNYVYIVDRQDMKIEVDPTQNDPNISHLIGEHLIVMSKRTDFVLAKDKGVSVIEAVTI